MASIQRRDGAYSVRWRDLRGRSRRRKCSTYATAQALKRDIERAIESGRDWRPNLRPADPDLVGAVAAYLRDRRRTLRESTLRIEAVTFGVWLEWALAHNVLEVGDLSRSVLADFWAHLVDVRSCKASTANKRIGRLVAFWRWAYDHEDLGRMTPRPRTIALPSAESVIITSPTWAHVDAVIAHARWAGSEAAPLHGGRTTYPYARALVLGRFTGLRGGQVQALEWRDLDFQRAELTVRPELGKTQAERRGRVVPVSAHLLDELAGWGRREGYVLGVPPSTRGDGEVWRNLWLRAGVPPELARQPRHGLRRAFIAGLARLGVDEEVRKALVGHTRGVHGVYTADGLRERMRAAVALVPPINTGALALRPRRRST